MLIGILCFFLWVPCRDSCIICIGFSFGSLGDNEICALMCWYAQYYNKNPIVLFQHLQFHFADLNNPLIQLQVICTRKQIITERYLVKVIVG